jgi:MoaA/NifB/PqqE/SkfB family radical SAM enzyme
VSASAWLRRSLVALRSGARVCATRARGGRCPVSVTFILTHRCDFACSHCNIPLAAGEEMTTREVCGAIDELAACGMCRASFSGGEALLRPDALAILRHARSRGLTTSLNTNGWQAADLMDELAPVLDMLVVSLEGSPERHDRRRRPGSHARAVRTLEEARRRAVPTSVLAVLAERDEAAVDEVLDVARRVGCWAYFQPAQVDCFSRDAGLDASLGPDFCRRLARRLRRARRAGLPVGNSHGYLARLERAPRFGDCAGCNAGRFFATLMPDGVFVPCHLVSRAAVSRDGRRLGFGRAFQEMPRPGAGPGCTISPYVESDLIFALDPGAAWAALHRLSGPPR